MLTTTYLTFEELDDSLRLNAPETVYKYRTWKDDNHKSLLVDRKVWFSHPFDLNDPLDVRPEMIFDQSEFGTQAYYQKLLATAANANPHLTSENALRSAANEQWEFTKANPEIVAKNYEEYNKTREKFNQYGVFSTSLNPLSERTWKEYGDAQAGYAIGFNTLELCREVKSGFGFVDYNDEPYKFSFLKREDSLDTLYLKKTSWQHEEEFRFITIGVGMYTKRLQGFSTKAVSEIILGYAISEADEKDIMSIIAKNYANLPIYKTKRAEDGKLSKERIV